VHYENKNIFFNLKKRSSLLQRWRCSCKFRSREDWLLSNVTEDIEFSSRIGAFFGEWIYKGCNTKFKKKVFLFKLKRILLFLRTSMKSQGWPDWATSGSCLKISIKYGLSNSLVNYFINLSGHPGPKALGDWEIALKPCLSGLLCMCVATVENIRPILESFCVQFHAVIGTYKCTCYKKLCFFCVSDNKVTSRKFMCAT
jgi:hypothetical protein